VARLETFCGVFPPECSVENCVSDADQRRFDSCVFTGSVSVVRRGKTVRRKEREGSRAPVNLNLVVKVWSDILLPKINTSKCGAQTKYASMTFFFKKLLRRTESIRNALTNTNFLKRIQRTNGDGCYSGILARS
jgi:hypothetical protein